MIAQRALTLLLCVCGLFAGCSAVDTVKGALGFGGSYTPLRTLTISADPEANQAVATQLDIVVIYDSTITDRLPKAGPDWFHQRNALQQLFATGIDVVSVQIPSGNPPFQVVLPKRIAKGIGVIAYANYVMPDGWPSITLTPFRSVTLRLMPNDIALTGQ